MILELLENSNSEWRELAYESWKSLGLDFEDEPFEYCYFVVLNVIGDLYFSELLKKAKIERLSNFLSNYTTFD